MVVRRAEVGRSGSESINVGAAVQAALLALILLLSPLAYDIWRMLGGS